MGAKFRLLKPKGQEQEREHIQQKKTMMLSEVWLHFNIMIIFVMTLFNTLSDLPRYSYKIKTIIHVFAIKMLSRRIPYYQQSSTTCDLCNKLPLFHICMFGC